MEKNAITMYYKKCTPVLSDPPVKKVIEGDEPEETVTFRFTLEGISNTANLEGNPMPEGSEGNIKQVEIEGAGEYEFGIITFTMPGTYIYKITEENTAEDNYEYDNSTYTVTYVVTQNNDKLEVERTIEKDGESADDVVFTNRFTKPAAPAEKKEKEPETVEPEIKEEDTPMRMPEYVNPHTGDSVQMYVNMFIISGCVMIIILMKRKKFLR